MIAPVARALDRRQWTRRLATLVLPWLVLGLVRAGFRIGFANPAEPGTVLARSIAIAAFWIPIAPVLYQFGKAWRCSLVGVLAPQVFAAIILEPAWTAAIVQPSALGQASTFLGWVIDRLDLNLFTSLAIVGLGVWRRHADDQLRLDAGDRARREALRRAELDLLNDQIQPHFLFNALNTVVELVHRDAALARQFVSDLDQLFARSVAAEGRAESTLGEEMDWLRSYLAVQRQRFGSRLALSIEVPDSLRPISVPNLVLQPLAENAIRHGVEAVEGDGIVAVEAFASSGRLTVVIRNPAPNSRAGGPGIGLRNARRRLEMAYQRDFTLSLERVGSTATTTLTIPVRPARPAHPEGAWVTSLREFPRSRLSTGAGIGLAFGAWVLILAVWYLAVHANARLTGADPWGGALMAIEAIAYLSLTVGAVWAIGLARRKVRRTTGWLLGAVLVVVAAILVAEGLGSIAAQPSGLGWRKANWAEQRLAILGAILVAAHSWWQHQARADAATAAAELEDEVERARFAQLRWRVQPTLVRKVLRQARDLAAADPGQAEQLLLALSRLLRGTLDRANDEWADLVDELEHVANFRRLVAMIEPTNMPSRFAADPSNGITVPRGALAELAGRLSEQIGLAPVIFKVSWRSSDQAFGFQPIGDDSVQSTAIVAVGVAARTTGLGVVTTMRNQVWWSLAGVPIDSPERSGAMTLEAAS